MNPAIERTIGRWLSSVHAGERHLAWNHPRLSDTPDTILLSSAAFDDREVIPQRHAGKGVGENVAPPLSWSVLPFGAVEYVLIVQDPDAPIRRPPVHLLATGIAADRTSVPEGYLTLGVAQDIHLGRGFMGHRGWAGPRPVRGHGLHRYVFQIFALSRRLNLGDAPDYGAVVKAMTGAVLARGRLIGTYERR